MATQLPGPTGPIRRLVAVAALAMAAGIALAGCSAGQDAQTVNQKPPIDGASETVGDLAIRNAAISSSSGDSTYAQGGNALVQFVVINNSPQDIRLTDVSTSAASSVLLSNSGQPAAASASDSASSSTSSSGAAGSSSSASSSASASSSSSSSSVGSSSAATSPSVGASTTVPDTASNSASGTASSGASSGSGGTGTAIVIPAGQTVQIGFNTTGATVLLRGLTAPLYPAQNVSVTFSFSLGTGQGAATRTITSQLPVRVNTNPPSAPVISEATEPGSD